MIDASIRCGPDRRTTDRKTATFEKGTRVGASPVGGRSDSLDVRVVSIWLCSGSRTCGTRSRSNASANSFDRTPGRSASLRGSGLDRLRRGLRQPTGIARSIASATSS